MRRSTAARSSAPDAACDVSCCPEHLRPDCQSSSGMRHGGAPRVCSCRSVGLSVQSFRACQACGTGVKVWRRLLPAALTRQPPEEQATPPNREMRCNRRVLLRLFKPARRTWLISVVTTHVDMPAERGCTCSKECESPHSLGARTHEDACMHFEPHRSHEGRRASHHRQQARKPRARQRGRWTRRRPRHMPQRGRQPSVPSFSDDLDQSWLLFLVVLVKLRSADCG